MVLLTPMAIASGFGYWWDGAFNIAQAGKEVLKCGAAPSISKKQMLLLSNERYLLLLKTIFVQSGGLA